ncbi:Uncharacterized protein YpmB [Alkalibacterium subtropicum]|uniref:Uncharacterized protein YpmB n=1 Tax=Alkalibacterium subtropicum TaxID=753702 RepID=A0A1I1IZS1_9LACT|nr:DUF5590 domain-containing protein [Alkalibacterium subtropicum]SFC41829.1 Uncharacterized protein YpmB [Alkalibacterium subtropicum]
MKKVIIGLVLTLSAVIVGAIYLYQSAHAPYAQAEDETITFLSERTDLDQIEDFYWYNGEVTTFTVRGSNEAEEEKLYMVQPEGGAIVTFDAEETVSEQQARRATREAREPKRILNAKIGLMNDTPIWEVTYKNENDRLGYYIIHLQTGEWLRTIDNI